MRSPNIHLFSTRVGVIDGIRGARSFPEIFTGSIVFVSHRFVFFMIEGVLPLDSSCTIALSFSIFSSVLIWFFHVSIVIVSTLWADDRDFGVHHSCPMRDQVTLPMKIIARIERSMRAMRISWFVRVQAYIIRRENTIYHYDLYTFRTSSYFFDLILPNSISTGVSRPRRLIMIFTDHFDAFTSMIFPSLPSNGPSFTIT